MAFHSLGDLAGHLMLSTARLRADQNITRLSRELSTGLTTQVSQKLKNDFSALSDWERSISSAKVRENTLSEAISRLQAKQTVLSAVGTRALELADDIGLVMTTGSSADQVAVSAKAKEALADALSSFNTRAADQTIFAGKATNGAAMSDVATVFASAKAAVMGSVTAADVLQAVDVWMDDALGGFPAVAYLGSDEDGPPIRVENGRTISDVGKANDPAIKLVLKSLLTAALATDEDIALSGQGSEVLLQGSSNDLRNAQTQLIQLEASIGQTQALATRARTRASAEITTAEMLRSDALSVDQYEVATKLQDAELQLEKIYMLTARSARLSLLEYLR